MKIEPVQKSILPIDFDPIGEAPIREFEATVWPAMRRGACNRCPVCGCRPLFAGYLRVTPVCSQCHTKLGAVRADDMPPYFTILLLGHVIVPLLLVVEVNFTPPLWLEGAIFLPLTAILGLALLRPIKGACVAWLLHQQRTADPRHARL